MLEELLQRVPVFVLVLFRLAGMMLFAPLFGSSRVPRRVKGALLVVLAFGMSGGVEGPAALPETMWGLAVGIGGEMVFGLAMGMILSFVFIATQWAGEIIGQQMGFDLGQVLDPQFGGAGSIVGELYFMLTLVIFLGIGGHRAMLLGVHASFDALPLLSVGMDRPLLELLAGLLQGATALAIRLAAPMLVTMLVVDLALGLVGKTMPQLNIMQTGMTLRAALGTVVIVVGLSLTSGVIQDSVADAMNDVRTAWVTPPAPE